MTRPESNRENDDDRPSSEVKPRASRRSFSRAYKLSILDEADACTKHGELGALLRREGLYSSHLSNWRGQRDRGELKGAAKKRGPKPREVNPLDKRVRELERENAKLRRRAKRAEDLIEVQKKVSDLWGVTLPKSDDDVRSHRQPRRHSPGALLLLTEATSPTSRNAPDEAPPSRPVPGHGSRTRD